MRWGFIFGLIIVTIAVALGFFFTENRQSEESVESLNTLSMETIRIKTQDGVKIVGDYYSPTEDGTVVNGAAPGGLLLHMMPSDRRSWTKFAEKLQQAGFAALAIDLRGHGESPGGPNGYKNFSDEDHQASRLDVEAAVDFLKEKGAVNIHLVGASIGANLSLEYAASHSEVRSVVLLSPGLDYRGLKTESWMERLSAEPGVLLVASEDDDYSRNSVNTLAGKMLFDEKRGVRIFASGGHGTNILENHPEFIEEIIKWLKQF